ncbi:RRP15-like protein, partial [Homalodisca vitripennis]|uniref:RRP15-like protein n=1 Tax=Homalodisca vitripennis TaxID=197043 RepID=UPI001EEAAA35
MSNIGFRRKSLGESESDLQEDVDHMDTSGSEDNDGNESVQPEKSKENLAWADAMSKILKTNKPKRRKTIVLSRAKRANQVKSDEVKEEKLDFEIEGDGSVAVKIEQSADSCEIKEESLTKRFKRKKNGLLKDTLSQPSWRRTEKKYYRKLLQEEWCSCSIAVRRTPENSGEGLGGKDAGPIEHKKEPKFSSHWDNKRAFLGMFLMGPIEKSNQLATLFPKEVKKEAK